MTDEPAMLDWSEEIAAAEAAARARLRQHLPRHCLACGRQNEEHTLAECAERRLLLGMLRGATGARHQPGD